MSTTSSYLRPRPRAHPRAFTLIEAVLSSVIVVTMFAAGMSAAAAAARDRLVQRETRLRSQLARSLISEIAQQRYADASPNTIAPYPGISTESRADWTHINDYHGLRETTPKDRAGNKIPGADGYSWQASVTYVPVSSPAPATGGTGGLLGGLLGAVGGTVSAVLDTLSTSATDTGLKNITVTVNSPSGKTTTLTTLRSAAGAVDRTSTGFIDFASIDLTIGPDAKPLTTGAPLLNTPAIP